MVAGGRADIGSRVNQSLPIVKAGPGYSWRKGVLWKES